MDLALQSFIENLSVGERAVFKSRLTDQIDQYFDSENKLVLPNPISEKNFNLLAETLRVLTPFSEKIPTDGIAYFGYPNWLTPELIQNLQEEAIKRRNQPLDRTDHFLGCGGYHADLLAESTDVVDFVSQYVGKVSPTGVASYLYYDRPGDGIRPHVDTEVFSVNMIIMLKHKHEETREKSATVVFPAHQTPLSFRLNIGEVLIMYGSSVIHTRSIISPGEEIQLLTIGYKMIN